MRALRICMIASSRFPVAEPFAGGLEAHTHALARELLRRGHDVTLWAGAGSDPMLGASLLPIAEYEPSAQSRQDVGALPGVWMSEHHAYLGLMLALARDGHMDYDLVHNNSLHYLPVALASTLSVPIVTTLHTPPIAWLESAARFAAPNCRFVAVSDHICRAWAHAVAAVTVRNGVDTDLWGPGPGGDRAVWAGRLVPEKAPHVAIDAARRAGLSLDIAGPVFDDGYFQREIVPRLGDDVRLVGHLTQAELRSVIGRARVAIVTPDWDEPYGLVAAEAMACGTPVAAVRRGAMAEVVDDDSGRLADPGDVDGLAHAVLEAAGLDRGAVRDSASSRFALVRMIDEYERLYESMLGEGLAA
jgi:glycosyltransferase involved in cell wall biosynthesis